jgi:hypothetical protein
MGGISKTITEGEWYLNWGARKSVTFICNEGKARLSSERYSRAKAKGWET